MKSLTLALDTLGGDFGIKTTIPACFLCLKKYKNINFILFGNKVEIIPLLEKFQQENSDINLSKRISIQHAPNRVDDLANIKQIIQSSKDCSMYQALSFLSNDKADGMISAGSTQALFVLAKHIIPTIDNLLKPALASFIPTMNKRKTMMLDLGANINVSEDVLYQFTQMGRVLVNNLTGINKPTTALLNIGTEFNKGLASVKKCNQKLQKSVAVNHIGFIEADKILDGLVDLIICDGWTGNIALKTLEGTVRNLINLTDNKTKFIEQFNPDTHNGASLVGLKKVVVKSHGGANSDAFFNALEYTISQIEQQIPNKIYNILTPTN